MSKYDENAFIWVRVAQPWRGTRMGTAFIPRVGNEVTVDYLGGDPDYGLPRGLDGDWSDGRHDGREGPQV